MSMHFPVDSFVQECRERENSPFAGVDLVSADLPPKVKFRIEAGLADPWPDTQQACVGRLLACAVWHGALLARNFWPQWVAALNGGVRFGSSLWFEMAPLDPTQAGVVEGHPRRWFADPLSQVLILRWRQRARPAQLDDALDVEECLASYLDPSSNHGPARALIDQFIHAAVLRWRCRMPGVLVEAALGHTATFTLTPATWERLVTAAPIRVEAAPVASRSEPMRWSFSNWPDDRGAHYTMQDVFAAATKDDPILSKRQQHNRAVRELEAMSRGAFESEVSVLMRRWCIAMLKEDLQASGKRGYRPSSAWNYLIAFRREVLPPGTPGTLGDLSATYLRERYRGALGRLPEGHRRNHLINAIQAFQRFVLLAQPELALSTEWMNSYRRSTDGAVNLISSRDYSRALAALPDRHASDTRMLRICLILGFRTGLRLPEIRALTAEDICVQGAAGSEHIELVVRNRRHNRTKTEWSRRVLPLHLLLVRSEDPEQCEVSEFLSWFRDGQRLSALTGCSTLFVNPDRPIERVRHGALEYPLNDILQRVTGDATVSFGTLRHSFLSCMLATLLLPEDGTRLALPAGLDENSVSQVRKERVGPALVGEERLGQAALHAVSQLAGHAPVETTLRHYAHLLDWVIGAYVCRPSLQVAWTINEAHNLTGLATSTIRTARQHPSTAPDDLEQSPSDNYRLPKLIRSVPREDHTEQNVESHVFTDDILAQATRAALRGAPTFSTSHYPFRTPYVVHRSRRAGRVSWVNWRMVKAVLDVDGDVDGCNISLRDISEKLDIPVEWACRWAENRQKFLIARIGSKNRRRLANAGTSLEPISLPLKPADDGELRYRLLMAKMKNFPKMPTKVESLAVDLVWSRAVRCASEHLQSGLVLFRDFFDDRGKTLTVAKWSDAYAFYVVALLLGFEDELEISHGTDEDDRRYRDELRCYLTSTRPPADWHGQVQFRFRTDTGPSRERGLLFALTILTIVDAEFLAQVRGGERPCYVKPVEKPKSMCVLAWTRRSREPEAW